MMVRFADEQIAAMIKEQEEGESTADVCYRRWVSEGTLDQYRSTYPNHYTPILNIWYPVGLGAFFLLLGLAGERLFRRARF